MTPEEFFAGHPGALEVFDRVHEVCRGLGPVEVRVTRSQVAFRRAHGFAFLWLPGMYLDNPPVDLVLTIALGRHDDSPRFREVVHPSARQWIHHLVVHEPADVDDEVVAWVAEAADRAG